MKVAHIVPAALYPVISQRGYQMALAQFLGREPAYLAVYKALHRRGAFIMVDNGTAEGTPLAWPDVVNIANMVHADEVVMSDVMRDGKATVELARSIQAENLISPNRRMVVPQGKSWDEWEACLVELTMYCEFATIGVAKHLESLPGGRVHALEILSDEQYSFFNIHMLGCYNHPLKEICAIKRFGSVRGIDTGAAVAYAQANILLDPDRDVDHKGLDWHVQVEAELVTQNITTIENMAYGT